MLFSQLVAIVLKQFAPNFKVQLYEAPLVQTEDGQYELELLAASSPNLKSRYQVVQVVDSHLPQSLLIEIPLIGVVMEDKLEETSGVATARVPFKEVNEPPIKILTVVKALWALPIPLFDERIILGF